MSWHPHMHRSNGACQKMRLQIRLRCGRTIWFSYWVKTPISLIPSNLTLNGQRNPRPSQKRGLTDDESVPEGSYLTAAQKVVILERMLGQIANYCPIISRNTIVKNSTSLEDIWQAIKLHFGLQHTGAHFLDFAEMRQEPVEKPEDLYQRLVAFVDDNLLTQGSVITHHGESQTEEEDITPTVENFIVLTWLRLIHPELPRLVKQRYGPELRSRTFATIKPEISQALHSLVDKLRTSEDARVLRTAASQFRPSRQFSSNRTSHKPKEKFTCECPLCQQTKRPRTDHFLSTCPFLSERDKKYMLHARLVTGVDDLGLEESYSDDEDNALALPDPGEHGVASVLRVMITESPTSTCTMAMFLFRSPLTVPLQGTWLTHWPPSPSKHILSLPHREPIRPMATPPYMLSVKPTSH